MFRCPNDCFQRYSSIPNECFQHVCHVPNEQFQFLRLDRPQRATNCSTQWGRAAAKFSHASAKSQKMLHCLNKPTQMRTSKCRDHPGTSNIGTRAPQKLTQSNWCVPFPATFRNRRKIGAFSIERYTDKCSQLSKNCAHFANNANMSTSSQKMHSTQMYAQTNALRWSTHLRHQKNAGNKRSLGTPEARLKRSFGTKRARFSNKSAGVYGKCIARKSTHKQMRSSKHK